MRLIIISGHSGSGKTFCLNILEDLGFYCISNLPLNLLANLPEQLENSHPEVVVSIDARNLGQNNKTYAELLANFMLKRLTMRQFILMPVIKNCWNALVQRAVSTHLVMQEYR